MKTQEKGQFIVIMYRAYLLDFLLNFLKLNLKIMLLSNPNPMLESAHLCSNHLESCRIDSFQKMAIIILYKAYLLDFFLTQFLKT